MLNDCQQLLLISAAVFCIHYRQVKILEKVFYRMIFFTKQIFCVAVKQFEPLSDFSKGSSLVWVHTFFCNHGFQRITKDDTFGNSFDYDDDRIKFYL